MGLGGILSGIGGSLLQGLPNLIGGLVNKGGGKQGDAGQANNAQGGQGAQDPNAAAPAGQAQGGRQAKPRKKSSKGGNDSVAITTQALQTLPNLPSNEAIDAETVKLQQALNDNNGDDLPQAMAYLQQLNIYAKQLLAYQQGQAGAGDPGTALAYGTSPYGIYGTQAPAGATNAPTGPNAPRQGTLAQGGERVV